MRERPGVLNERVRRADILPVTDTSPQDQPEHGLRRVLEAAGVALATLDGEGHVTSASSGFGQLWGRPGADLVGMHVLSMVPEEDQPDVLAALVRLLEGVSDLERAAFSVPGGRDAVRVQLTLAATGDSQLVAVARELDAPARAERRRHLEVVELARLVADDPGSGRPRQDVLDALIASAVRRSARHGRPFATIVVETVADRVTELLATRLTDRLRPADAVRRAGDGRLVVVAEELGDVQDAAGVAYRLLAAVVEPFELPEGPAQVSVALGIAVADGATAAGRVLDAAAAALEQARTDGPGGFRIIDLRPGLAA